MTDIIIVNALEDVNNYMVDIFPNFENMLCVQFKESLFSNTNNLIASNVFEPMIDGLCNYVMLFQKKQLKNHQMS